MIQPLESRILAQRFAVQLLWSRIERLSGQQTLLIDADLVRDNAFATLLEERVPNVVGGGLTERKPDGHHLDEMLHLVQHRVDFGDVLNDGNEWALW